MTVLPPHKPASAQDVLIRGLRRRDTAALTDLMSGPQVIHGLSVLPCVSEFEIDRLIQPMDNRHWMIAEVDGIAVGFVYLEWGKGRWRRIATLVMGIDDRYAGKKIGKTLVTTALDIGFTFIDLHKIELVVYVDNKHAIRLYESCGFIHEGTKRGNAIRKGEHIDAHVMSILKVDYETSSKAPLAKQKIA